VTLPEPEQFEVAAGDCTIGGCAHIDRHRPRPTPRFSRADRRPRAAGAVPLAIPLVFSHGRAAAARARSHGRSHADVRRRHAARRRVRGETRLDVSRLAFRLVSPMKCTGAPDKVEMALVTSCEKKSVLPRRRPTPHLSNLALYPLSPFGTRARDPRLSRTAASPSDTSLRTSTSSSTSDASHAKERAAAPA